MKHTSRSIRSGSQWISLFGVLVLVFGLVQAAWAQSATPPLPVTDDQVNAIAKQLYCPVCESTPLDVCQTQACEDWREEIRLKLSQGWTETQIKQYFVDRFGDRVIGVPPARGINWLVYIIPPIAIIAGAYILYRAFKAWQQSPAPDASSATEAPPADEYVKRLEEQLKESDK